MLYVLHAHQSKSIGGKFLSKPWKRNFFSLAGKGIMKISHTPTIPSLLSVSKEIRKGLLGIIMPEDITPVGEV